MNKYKKNQYVKKILLIGIISFITVFSFTMILNVQDYPYDSAYYYNLAESFFQDGRFSLTNFPNSIRGILFPLLLCFFNQISNVIFGTKLFGIRILISLLSAIFAVVFPIIFKPEGKKIRIPVPLILLMMVWWGLFTVPLSDLSAVYFLIYALVCINKAYLRVGLSKTLRYKELLLFVLSGIFLYAAYNVRSIYILAFPFVFGIIIVNRSPRKEAPAKGLFNFLRGGVCRSFLIVCAICVGIISVGCIQGYSNKYLRGKFSLSVSNENTELGEHDSLFMFRLITGMGMNLYETYIEDGIQPNYSYVDLVERQMIKAEGGIVTFGDYLKTMLKYPVESLGIYTRHFVLALNPIGGGGYIYSRNNYRFILTLMNFTMIFIAANFLKRKMVGINIKSIKQSAVKKTVILSLGSLLLASLVTMASAIEDRYELSLWLVIYGILAYYIDFKQEILYYKQHLISNVVAYCVWFCVFAAIITAVYGNNPEGILLPVLNLN